MATIAEPAKGLKPIKERLAYLEPIVKYGRMIVTGHSNARGMKLFKKFCLEVLKHCYNPHYERIADLNSFNSLLDVFKYAGATDQETLEIVCRALCWLKVLRGHGLNNLKNHQFPMNEVLDRQFIADYVHTAAEKMLEELVDIDSKGVVLRPLAQGQLRRFVNEFLHPLLQSDLSIGEYDSLMASMRLLICILLGRLAECFALNEFCELVRSIQRLCQLFVCFSLKEDQYDDQNSARIGLILAYNAIETKDLLMPRYQLCKGWQIEAYSAILIARIFIKGSEKIDYPTFEVLIQKQTQAKIIDQLIQSPLLML
ncbi:hypothetical protein Ciccas_000980 [Cichlidogyrus casuarinus]|uniref:Uncharacterized protein n=1 Tax=Cichlidogyrus casuarinus TaxID=1844966 RepID=A0ABD2QLC5_9PLAT